MNSIKAFTQKLDTARLEQAIAAAELRTSGEVRVVLQAGKVADPTARAAQEFARLKMHETAERNAVLFFVAPDARCFAVYGDQGVHAKCGESFWQAVAQAMETHFKAGDPTAALVEGIARAGELLAKEYPRQHDDRDELPNTIIERPSDHKRDA